MVENSNYLNCLRNGYLEKSVATGICRVQRSPKTAKTPRKVHLRLRFQNPGKPRTAGLCGRAAGACDCGPLSCTKIERPSPLEKPFCKVRFFAQNRSRKYRQKVTVATLSPTTSHPDFQLLAQTAHVRFCGRKWVHLAFAQRIAHKGTHGETGGVSDGGGITTLGAFHTFRKPCVAGYQNGKLCRFWALVGGALEEHRKPSEQRCAYARRCSEASRPRWAALSCRYCVNDKKYDQSVGRFTTLLIRRNRWLPIFQPRLVDFWRAFW